MMQGGFENSAIADLWRTGNIDKESTASVQSFHASVTQGNYPLKHGQFETVPT